MKIPVWFRFAKTFKQSIEYTEKERIEGLRELSLLVTLVLECFDAFFATEPSLGNECNAIADAVVDRVIARKWSE